MTREVYVGRVVGISQSKRKEYEIYKLDNEGKVSVLVTKAGSFNLGDQIRGVK
jgi:hypothetical protein